MVVSCYIVPDTESIGLCSSVSQARFGVLRVAEHSAMGFLMEFVEHWIRRSMEDPDERDAKFRKHVQETKAQCETLKATWASPVKPYGSWNTDKNNAKFLQDLKLSGLAGRKDPYEEIASASSRS